MSETTSSAKLEEDEQNPTHSSFSKEGQVRLLKKGKKKGKGKKASTYEEGDDEEDSSPRKKKGKKKAAPKTSISSDIQPEVEATSETKQLKAAVDETPKETVIEIQGEEKRPEELEEIVVDKESTLIKGDNVVQEEGDSGEGSGEEKKDVEQEKVGEEEAKEKEVVPEVEGATVRRRATLSDLRGESMDKGDGEQAVSTAAGSEV